MRFCLESDDSDESCVWSRDFFAPRIRNCDFDVVHRRWQCIDTHNKKSAEDLVFPHGTPIDTDSRELLLRAIWRAQIRVATMAMLFVLGMGWIDKRDVPLWPLSLLWHSTF